ncbi:MAG TPA: hypothetical protein VK829_03530 [Terriglobales bacterium]|jgi:hypothetical protein|nr:hypothetical protein [Terriglobales bacterium]
MSSELGVIQASTENGTIRAVDDNVIREPLRNMAIRIPSAI